MLVLLSLLTSTCMAAEPKLTFEGAKRHPTVNVTPEDVARARRQITSDAAAKTWFESLEKSVAPWADKDPAWVRSVMPGEGASFAYGFTGCPICGGRWSAWGGARCSFDKPGKVTCSGEHVLPDADHPDPGTGYKAPDGRIHYFVGSYNAWVVETLIFKIAEPYAKIHLLTGDDRAGRMAAVILDEIARIYPSCDKGSWDYPSNPPSGRLCRPWYQVARVLVHFVDIYDWIYGHPALDEPSSRRGLTRRQNIEKNLLLNGAAYCYDMSVRQGGLHNGQADYLRGALAVGVVLGIPEYITWPVEGTYGIRTMLANNVDRDGRYFETASGYALHTRNLYLTFAEPLFNYRGSVFPNGLNLYDDPKFQSFCLLPQMATVCLGHEAPFGDAAPVFRTRTKHPYHPATIYDLVYTERLATRVSDPKQRAAHAALLQELRRRDPDADRRIGDLPEWRIFHGPGSLPTGGTLTARMTQYLDGSFFVGQKGLAVLRLGGDESAQAAIVRFGPSLVHGHLDDLNVNYFARGREMTYDIGYSLGSTHTQVGWAKQTISHNTVVVDETSQGGGMFGGSLLHFADLPGCVLAEGSSVVYADRGVGVYRRLIALTDRYALDVFRVRGGGQHDLPLHGLSTRVDFSGIAFGQPKPGSLAGETYRWGELQLNDGDMKGYAGKPYWNPPPGNGYGFLCRPAYAKPTGNWSATWAMEEGTRYQLLALHQRGTEVATAVAPGLYPTFPSARHVIRRRKGNDLSSCFVSIWQSYDGNKKPSVKSLRRIDGDDDLSAETAVALVAELSDGQRDVWCLAPSADATVSAKTGDVEIAARGAIARCRLNGDDIVSVEMIRAQGLSVAGWRFTLDGPSRNVPVAELPTAGKRSIKTNADWIDDGRYDGLPIYVANRAYSRNSAYTIDHVSGREVTIEQADTILGMGVVSEVKGTHTLVTKVPHEYARTVSRHGASGFFKGKLLRTEDGRAGTHIREIQFGPAGTMTIDVDSTTGLEPGQTFIYHDVRPGDTLTVHHHLSMVREEPGRYRLRTNADVTIRAPGQGTITYLDKSGRRKEVIGGRIPRGELSRSGQTMVTLTD